MFQADTKAHFDDLRKRHPGLRITLSVQKLESGCNTSFPLAHKDQWQKEIQR